LEQEGSGYRYIPLLDGDKDKRKFSPELGMTMKI